MKIFFYLPIRVECGLWKSFFIGQNRSTNQSPGMILEVQIHARQSFNFQIIPGGPKINIFFWKIGMKLPFTLKSKCRNTNLKFDFKKVPLWTPKKVHFWFLKKIPQKIVFFVFRHKKRTNLLLVGTFENAQILHFGSFRQLIMFCLCIFKNIDQDTIFVSIVLQAKT